MVDLRKISKKQFLAGMNAALKNARSLVKEAELLAEHKAYSRAFVLNVLSLEESAKVVFLTMCAHSDRFDLDQKTINRIWKLYSSHQVKISFFESGDSRKWKRLLYVRKRKHNNENEEYFKKTVKPLHRAYIDLFEYLKRLKLSSVVELKSKCLYVDINKNRLNFQAPIRVPHKVVKAMIRITKQEIKDTERLRDTFRRAKTDQLSEDIVAAVFSRELAQQFIKELSTLSIET